MAISRIRLLQDILAGHSCWMLPKRAFSARLSPTVTNQASKTSLFHETFTKSVIQASRASSSKEKQNRNKTNTHTGTHNPKTKKTKCCLTQPKKKRQNRHARPIHKRFESRLILPSYRINEKMCLECPKSGKSSVEQDWQGQRVSSKSVQQVSGKSVQQRVKQECSFKKAVFYPEFQKFFSKNVPGCFTRVSCKCSMPKPWEHEFVGSISFFFGCLKILSSDGSRHVAHKAFGS